MAEAAVLAELWRGDFLEGVHRGHAVIADHRGEVVEAWGDAERLIFPRSAIKILQALPLVESGAAERAGVGAAELALACASHKGSLQHTDRVVAWLDRIGLSEADLRCGPQTPADREARHGLRAAGAVPGQRHNNCSGKHTGFLTLSKALGGGPEYIDPHHPVQLAVREAMEALTGVPVAGHGIDGCSAPNFVTTLRGFATAMARFARPEGGVRGAAMARLVGAMRDHPVLIDGAGSATTEITAASGGAAVIKTGAEGVFSAILPERGLGIALKIEDGATRASEAAIAALLVRLGVFERGHAAVARRIEAVQPNRRGLAAAYVRAAGTLLDGA